MGRRFLTPPSLSAQLFRLSALELPGAQGHLWNKRAKLRFDFSVTPTLFSREYRCRLELERGGFSPQAFVLSPDLKQLAQGERPPHTYPNDHSERTRLCLFLPGSGEWTTRSWLADTMLPWTISWLRFYEIWLATGVWEGGGEHPRVDKDTPLTLPRRRYGMAGRR